MEELTIGNSKVKRREKTIKLYFDKGSDYETQLAVFEVYGWTVVKKETDTEIILIGTKIEIGT